MNRLVFYGISFLAFMSHEACAVIFARTFWNNGKGQIVEIFYDAHALYFSQQGALNPEDVQQELLDSNALTKICMQQQHDSINYARQVKKIHLYIEDMQSLIHSTGACVEGSDYCSLSGLATLAQYAHIPHTNVEYRDSTLVVDRMAKTVKSSATNPDLTRYYNQLEQLVTDNPSHFNLINDYLFNVRLINTIYDGTRKGIPHQLFIGGGFHGLALAIALPLMGYTQNSAKTVINPELRTIMHHPSTKSETIIRDHTTFVLGTTLKDFKALIFSQPEHDAWTVAFWVTHPISITTLHAHDRHSNTLPAGAHAQQLPAHRSTAPKPTVIKSKL